MLLWDFGYVSSWWTNFFPEIFWCQGLLKCEKLQLIFRATKWFTFEFCCLRSPPAEESALTSLLVVGPAVDDCLSRPTSSSTQHWIELRYILSDKLWWLPDTDLTLSLSAFSSKTGAFSKPEQLWGFGGDSICYYYMEKSVWKWNI